MVPWGAPQEQGWRVRAGPLGGRQGLRTWDEGAPRVEEGVRRGGRPHGRGEGGAAERVQASRVWGQPGF